MISQTAEYALRAMTCLAQSPQDRTPSAAIAERTQAPLDYLAKVLQQLSDAGLIAGRRGVNGGYRVTRPPEEIKLTDVVSAVGRLERLSSCPLGDASPGTSLCALHHTMDQAIAALIDVLDSHTLADLVDHPDGLKPLCEAAPSGVTGNGEAVPAGKRSPSNGLAAR